MLLRTPEGWEPEARFTRAGGEPGDFFGSSVAIDGDVAVIGAVGVDGASTSEGAAFIFSRTPRGWGRREVLLDPTPSDWTRFGAALALDGDTLLACAENDGSLGGEAGMVSHFELAPALETFCPGDGSGSACPCGNESAPGEAAGCTSSSGQGATLWASGSASAMVDDLTFSGRGLPPGQPALLFVAVGSANGGAGELLGDGLRCAGGGVIRLGVSTASPAGSVQHGPGLGGASGWGAGDTRTFQLWFRDPAGPCLQGMNLSAGLRASFGA